MSAQVSDPEAYRDPIKNQVQHEGLPSVLSYCVRLG